MSEKLTPQQKRILVEKLSQPVWDGGDKGELMNERACADRYEEILSKVADVLGCPSDFGMILPNLSELKRAQWLDANELRERLSDIAHDAWAGWMKYMFGKGQHIPYEYYKGRGLETCFIMPSELRLRWERQMRTPYAELSEAEKNSDRDEADKYLGAMRAARERFGGRDRDNATSE